MSDIVKLDRRDFVKLGAVAGTGLLLGVRLPETGRRGRRPAGALQPSVWVRVDTSGDVTIWLGRSEMGQGVKTALPMIVADEMDADWSRVRIEHATAHPTKWGSMLTAGSSSVRGGAWNKLRIAGASARAMLVGAAAARWGVPASECTTSEGRVTHAASQRSAGYGELAEAASALPVPAKPALKDPSQWKLIGTRVPLVDSKEKVTGAAVFGADVRVPGMLFATVLHPPVFGGSVASFDAARARAVAGVKDVVQISKGVVVVADSTWAAFTGARKLDVRWQNGAFAMNTEDVFREFARLAEGNGVSAEKRGDAGAALARATTRLQATYEAPYLAHATMEPMNCTADARQDRCEIWAPTQNAQAALQAAVRITGLPVDAVTVHVTYLGCGWGRRAQVDFVSDAVETSMKIGAPVQVMWTREEDMQHDFYRPAAHVRLEGGLDANGRLSGLRARVVAQPLSGRGAVDASAVLGFTDMSYTFPDYSVEYMRAQLPVPVTYWRAPGTNQNVFFLESFIDEMAHSANRDPVAFRLELLADDPRMQHAVEVCAREAGWGTPLPAGHARGIGLTYDKGGRCVEIADVSLEGGRIRVHRVTCVADCGIIVHPRVAEAQMVGSIGGGITAALYGEVTLAKGRVTQRNFNDYPLLRMRDAPEVRVLFIPSREEPGGVGEPALPPIAPAIANALFALTGKRARRLPLRASDFVT